MRKILGSLAMLFMACAAPAQAGTFIRYYATGTGSADNNLTHVNTPIDIFVELVVRVDPGWLPCQGGFACSFSGTKVNASTQPLTGTAATLNFDHILTGWPTTNAGFLGGSALTGCGTSCIVHGTFTSLAVTTFEDSAINGGHLLITYREIAAPEPDAWVLLITGFSLTGAALRRRRMQALLATRA